MFLTRTETNTEGCFLVAVAHWTRRRTNRLRMTAIGLTFDVARLWVRRYECLDCCELGVLYVWGR